jgi:hypothetical protein
MPAPSCLKYPENALKHFLSVILSHPRSQPSVPLIAPSKDGSTERHNHEGHGIRRSFQSRNRLCDRRPSAPRPGLLESAYEQNLAHELSRHQVAFQLRRYKAERGHPTLCILIFFVLFASFVVTSWMPRACLPAVKRRKNNVVNQPFHPSPRSGVLEMDAFLPRAG